MSLKGVYNTNRETRHPFYVKLPADARSPTGSIYKEFDIVVQGAVLWSHYNNRRLTLRSRSPFVLRVLTGQRVKDITARRTNTCILEVDSPSYPPSDDERKQCGCEACERDLERIKMDAELKWRTKQRAMGNELRCPYCAARFENIIEHDEYGKHVVFLCFNCRRIVEVKNVTGEWKETIEIVTGGQNETASRDSESP